MITFASSICRLHISSSVRAESEHPFSVILEEKLVDVEAPPKPYKADGKINLDHLDSHQYIGYPYEK